MVEHSAVNRRVVGSSPTWGANFFAPAKACFLSGVEPATLQGGVGGQLAPTLPVGESYLGSQLTLNLRWAVC